jgi:hypothetical protein
MWMRLLRRRALRAVAAVGLALATSPARAGEDGQVWVPIQARIKVDDRFKLWLEGQQRMGGNGMRQELIRTALGYQVKPWWGLYLGYGWTPSFNEFHNESRIYQESFADNALGDLRVMNRTRLEERFIEDVQGVSVRLRHMVRVTYPLERSNHWFLAASDEPFVTLNDRLPAGPIGGFDQNRAYAGIRYRFTPAVAVELGYMHQYINRPPGQENVSSNNAVVTFDFSL